MPDIPSCQNVSVSFGGVALGSLIGFDEGYSAASPTDTTGATATIVGSGGNTRVIRQVEITMIEPGSISFRCWGIPPSPALTSGSLAPSHSPSRGSPPAGPPNWRASSGWGLPVNFSKVPISSSSWGNRC